MTTQTKKHKIEVFYVIFSHLHICAACFKLWENIEMGTRNNVRMSKVRTITNYDGENNIIAHVHRSDVIQTNQR